MPDYGSTDGRADPAAKDPVIVVVMLTLCSYVNPLYSIHKLHIRDHILGLQKSITPQFVSLDFMNFLFSVAWDIHTNILVIFDP